MPRGHDVGRAEAVAAHHDDAVLDRQTERAAPRAEREDLVAAAAAALEHARDPVEEAARALARPPQHLLDHRAVRSDAAHPRDELLDQRDREQHARRVAVRLTGRRRGTRRRAALLWRFKSNVRQSSCRVPEAILGSSATQRLPSTMPGASAPQTPPQSTVAATRDLVARGGALDSS